MVFSVAYRPAREHPIPHGLHDCRAVFERVVTYGNGPALPARDRGVPPQMQ
jgi:acetyl esterase/lipase